MRLRVEPTMARTRWMFGFQRRLVRRWECDTLFPKLGLLPHTEQMDATTLTPEDAETGFGQPEKPTSLRAPTPNQRRPRARADQPAGGWAARFGRVVEERRASDLDVAACSRWVVQALARLEHCADTLDALNVFPVPDGDTGTNLLLTFRRAAGEARAASASIADLSAALARGALLGARGNSGIITAQVLAGAAEVFAECSTAVDGPALAAALQVADRKAWEAVALPVEGTVLSVSRACAEAVRDVIAGPDGARVDALQVALVAAKASREALARTPTQLTQLAEAGVVDAGGAGFCVLIDALAAALAKGSPAPLPGVDDYDLASHPRVPPVHSGTSFEVMFVHDSHEPTAGDRLRGALAEVGDSVVVVGSPGQWHVHLHTETPDVATAIGRAAGGVHDLRVIDLRTGDLVLAPARLGCVAWASGAEVATVLAGVGVRAVRSSAARRASTEELLAAIEATGCSEVVLLPNDPDSFSVARVAAATAGATVHLIESRSVVQGLAAAAVFDASVTADDEVAHLVASMRAAVRGCAYGAVARAWKPATTPAGPCQAGDALGLIGEEIVTVGADVTQTCVEIVQRLLPGELITIVLGPEAPVDLADRLRAQFVDAEVSVLHGAPDAYVAVVGVE